ncbi:MAG: ATP-binding protein [Candidatus Riflebacteria bacterium]|nr:ATP-binding protein [Candidatus Riflebacteria bacterium]
MIERPFWIKRILACWKEAPIVWLAGLRRVGKTTLVKSLKEQAMYLNCDLPAVAEMTAQPELFFRNCQFPVVIFDEIHQLADPSRLLKIGADEFPHIKILATGSSTLAATDKFKDSLTGRKRSVHLTPVLLDELPAFQQTPLLKRLYHGGFPQTVMETHKSEGFYREWMDSFFSRDIQRLFGFRDFSKFTLFFEYLLRQSGGLFELARASSELGISRPTLENYLQALSISHAVTILRPFHKSGLKELVKTPKVYAFDTGFVSFARGWDPLRPSDYGQLWEHLILEYLQAHFPERSIHFWRTSTGLEIDFLVPHSRDRLDCIECKWDPRKFAPDGLITFRALYPHGRNILLSPVEPAISYQKTFGALEVTIASPHALKTLLK